MGQGIELWKVDMAKIKLYKSKTWLHRRYVIERRTMAEMAQEARCSIETISRSLKEFDINE